MKEVDGFNEENIQYRWSRDVNPVLAVEPGERFRLKIPDSSTKQLSPDSTRDDLMNIDEEKIDGIIGPIYVEGSEPGDTIRVNIHSIMPGKWGWTGIFSKFGILGDIFDDKILHWRITGEHAISSDPDFLRGVDFTIKPFLGIVGTAPRFGKYHVIPPQYFGGNMDNRLIRAGSSVYLPVLTEGSLLYVSDPHALQGDGEVCGSALETSCECEISVDVLKDLPIKTPMIESIIDEGGRVFATTGISDNILHAAKGAVANMIDHLISRGYSQEEAYVMCSLAGNLRISEIVDQPNYVVSFVMDSTYILRGRS